MNKNKFVIKKEGKMNVDGVVYASQKIYDRIKQDKTLEQIKNVACLPGIVGKSIALADAHQGYGFPIGGVAAFNKKTGVICPGGIGYDINCGVRLLRTNLTKQEFEEKKEKIAESMSKKIPTGVGHGSPFQLSKKKLDLVLEGGAQYLVEEGYGKKEDYLHLESNGKLAGADSNKVSEKAKKRGIGQLGTLGAGNHFLDFLSVDELFNKEVAKTFGLKKNQIVILIHCGSRGLGHQVASDYIKKMEEEYGIDGLADRELINAPINSKLGKDYFSAMNAAANFAFANKQIITYWIREDLEKFFPKVKVEVVYEVCHNIAKFEEYEIDGKVQELCVHRKGATRSFGKGNKELPKDYQEVGQPVLIPGSMGTSSYVMVGNKNSAKETFSSCVHGAGRVMSRSKANREINAEQEKEKLRKKGIIVKHKSLKSVTEESVEVYKDIDEVVNVMSELKIADKVAKLTPIIVIIG